MMRALEIVMNLMGRTQSRSRPAVPAAFWYDLSPVAKLHPPPLTTDQLKTLYAESFPTENREFAFIDPITLDEISGIIPDHERIAIIFYPQLSGKNTPEK
jgi:hypothetical protein